MELILISFIINLLWGIPPLIFKFLALNFSYPLIMSINSIFNLFFLFIYISLFHYNNVKQEIYKLTPKTLFIFFILVFFSFFLANLCYFYLIDKGHNINLITILTAFYPIITIIFSFFFFKDDFKSLTYLNFIGFFLFFAGMFLILYKF
jgi:drug/metabolite transporter (DMT)-like permease